MRKILHVCGADMLQIGTIKLPNLKHLFGFWLPSLFTCLILNNNVLPLTFQSLTEEINKIFLKFLHLNIDNFLCFIYALNYS